MRAAEWGARPPLPTCRSYPFCIGCIVRCTKPARILSRDNQIHIEMMQSFPSSGQKRHCRRPLVMANEISLPPTGVIKIVGSFQRCRIAQPRDHSLSGPRPPPINNRAAPARETDSLKESQSHCLPMHKTSAGRKYFSRPDKNGN